MECLKHDASAFMNDDNGVGNVMWDVKQISRKVTYASANFSVL